MAYAKKTPKASEAFQKLKNDLAAGRAENAYIFYGEETYLREYYLKELRRKLIPAGFEEFNYHTLEGKDLTAETLAETAEAAPETEAAVLRAEGLHDKIYVNQVETLWELASARTLAALLDCPVLAGSLQRKEYFPCW